MDALYYKSLLDKKSLSSDEKIIVKDDYLRTFEREMRLKSTKCRDCYNDALLELINFNQKSDNSVREVRLNGRILKTYTK